MFVEDVVNDSGQEMLPGSFITAMIDIVFLSIGDDLVEQ